MGFFNKIAEGLKKTRDSMMGKVDALLNSFTKIDEEFFEELSRDNGAPRLACYLMENCTTVNLFIGKAINKDYTTKELPFEISVRQNLMKRMQTVLTAMHRTVHVYYY